MDDDGDGDQPAEQAVALVSASTVVADEDDDRGLLDSTLRSSAPLAICGTAMKQMMGVRFKITQHDFMTDSSKRSYVHLMMEAM